jgi:hypothetical protein
MKDGEALERLRTAENLSNPVPTLQRYAEALEDRAWCGPRPASEGHRRTVRRALSKARW